MSAKRRRNEKKSFQEAMWVTEFRVRELIFYKLL